jgi:hypothetical protein
MHLFAFRIKACYTQKLYGGNKHFQTLSSIVLQITLRNIIQIYFKLIVLYSFTADSPLLVGINFSVLKFNASR